MDEHSPPRAKFWDIEGWGLRWKVTAVLAVPVTVAMILGGLRVEAELSGAVQYTSAANQVSGIPDMVALEAAMGTLSGGVASGTALAEDRQTVEELLEQVSEGARNPELDRDVAASINKSVADTRSLLDLMDSGGVPPSVIGDRQRALAEDFIDSAELILAPVEDPEVIDKSFQLMTSWQAQRRLFDQAMAMVDLMNLYSTAEGRALARAGNIPMNDIVFSAGSESGLLDLLGRFYPEDDTQLASLHEQITTRNRLIDDGVADAAQGGLLPVLQIRGSLISSKDIYQDLTSAAAADIADTVTTKAADARSAALRDTAVVMGTLLAALILALLVSRSLVGPIRKLRYGALKAARRDLPQAIEKIKSSDDPRDLSFDPVPVDSTEEIGQLARAVDDMHGQALKLAGEQAQLRLQISDMFETLARRSKSLVDQQLGLIEKLEFEEKDPKRLESLFRLDHLAARMRRNGENLLVLAGTRVRRNQSAAVPLGDVLRAAISEVEDYQRVQVGATPEGALSGSVATDVVHLLAELVDNALRASPPGSPVTFGFARAVDGGVLLEIADRGIGVPTDELTEINERLASGGEVGPETARHMGLFVVSRLAQRHGLTVRMRPTFDTARNPGVTVSIHLPTSLIVAHSNRFDTGQQAVVAAPERPALPPRDTTRSEERPALPSRRESATAPAAQPPLPERNGHDSAPTASPPGSALPRRTPGASGITGDTGVPSAPTPAREPETPPARGAVTPPRPPRAGEPRPEPAGLDPVVDGSSLSLGDEAGALEQDQVPTVQRHRYRDPAKTASFFRARTEQPAQQQPPRRPDPLEDTGTPIFDQMVSEWLRDPTKNDGPPPTTWESPADAGWSAVERVRSTPAEIDPDLGLPKRRPGERLLPGTVEGAQTGTLRRVRDPETIRAKLSSHQRGVRSGRARTHTDTPSTEGER
ncbi:HAMP domain-containing protein [Rhodococcus triatomae]|uniref:histidine kinase n=1 Tax=Rhodococcus triatomae TaxID=300028 RepID=A0A1G8QXS5_9NOCA|nr:ATP-binding protein [Rhodococcus triatomae]QNG20757.1 HAMP domain-containing protein [Rhodococcus triatomae]QNG23327.1 HAMP domain-containing protein [Rhodococcus triatomae]SDJ09529.1 Signal transduction histidine kinase [Rhodococcus triatomae]